MIGKLILAVCVHQTLGLVSRFDEARTKYDQAQQAADERGKPLLVVGGPNGSNATYQDSWVAPFSAIKAWANIQPHGGGDVCVDLDPNACEGYNYIKADITDLPFHDKEFGAVLSSHVLEHMADADTCQRAFSELHRVADEVYLSLPPKSSSLCVVGSRPLFMG